MKDASGTPGTPPEPRPPAGPAWRLSDLSGTIADHLTDAIFVVSPEGRIHSWNVGAEKMFGYSRGEAVGVSYLDLIVPEDRVQLNRDVLHKVREAEHDNYETVRRRKDGEPLHVDGAMKRVLDSATGETHILVSER